MLYQLNDIETNAKDILNKKKSPVKTRGYVYLKTCIIIGTANPDSLNSINKNLYKVVADEHDSNIDSVERCIRAHIEKWWDDGLKNDSLFEKRPTNRECIIRFVEMMKTFNRPKNMEEWVAMWEGKRIIDTILDP